jgi:hypothetical protein
MLALAVGTMGCARDGDTATVRSVADTFFAALAAGDGARACEQLSPDTRANLESQEQSTCHEAITGLKLDQGAVVQANVYVLSAIVELSNGEAAFLDQGEEGWRIAAVGCEPSAKPADRPFDCELED